MKNLTPLSKEEMKKLTGGNFPTLTYEQVEYLKCCGQAANEPDPNVRETWYNLCASTNW